LNNVYKKDSYYFSLLGQIYLKIHDISSAIACFKKCQIVKNQEGHSEYSQISERLEFVKGYLTLKNSNDEIFSKALPEIKKNKCDYNLHYLK